MDLKQNDWMIAVLDNPTFTLSNFKGVGLNSSNTGMLSKDEYLSSPYIQEKFKDQNGEFDSAIFDKVYANALASYQTFANDDFIDNIKDNLEYDKYDQARPKDSSVRTPIAVLSRTFNPDRLKMGVSQIGRMDNREWTVSELAQKSKVFDFDTKEWKDYSPNDNVLFGNPAGFLRSIGEPLVIAQWDEDGEHIDPYSGRTVKHKKGEYKYNDEGDYYYETLGGREVYGKQVKSIFDSFTVDGSTLNKYDFFDSDSLDKSVFGSLFKSVATIAPVLVGGPVGLVYGGILVGTQLADILPMIYKTTIGVGEGSDTPVANYMQALGRSFRQGKSEYSQKNIITTENFFDLISDVVLQWAQQRALFNVYHKLAGTGSVQKAAYEKAAQEATKKTLTGELGEITEATLKRNVELSSIKAANALRDIMKGRNRMAANTALGYMAIMQGSEVFEDALSQGATREEAAAVTWGAIAGMYAIDRTGIGEIFFPELRGEGIDMRKAINQLASTDAAKRSLSYQLKDIASSAGEAIKADKKKWYSKLYNAGKDKSYKFFSDVRNHNINSIWGKMIGEGLEEVGEEFMTDFAKATFNWASDMGITISNTKLDAFENMMERYAINFAGGAIGGAIFGATDLYNVVQADNKAAKNSDVNQQEMLYLIRNGRTGELLEELEVMRKKGLLGDKNLSSTKQVNDANGRTMWASPTSVSDSQNEANYRMIKSYIKSMNEIINQNGMGFTDDQLLNKIVVADERVKSLIGHGLATKLFQDFNTLGVQIANIDQQIVDHEKTYLDTDKRGTSPNPEYIAGLERLRNQKAELIAKRDAFLNGNYSQHYVGQMVFAVDDKVNKPFFAANIKSFIEAKTGKTLEDIAPEQMKALEEEYEVYKKNSFLDNLDTAYSIFDSMRKNFSTKLQDASVPYESWLKYKTQIKDKVFKRDLPNENSLLEHIVNKNSGRLLNDAYQIQKFEIQSGETIQEAGEREARILEHNSKVWENIKKLLVDISSIGYVDKETFDVVSELLERNIDFQQSYARTIANPGNVQPSMYLFKDVKNPLNDVIFAPNEFKTPEELRDVDGNVRAPENNESEFWKIFSSEIIPMLKLNNLEEVKGRARDLANNIIDKFNREYISDIAAEFYDNDIDPTPIFEGLNKAKENVNKMVDTILDETYNAMLIDNPEISSAISTLSNIQESPLVQFVQELTKDITSSKLPILDMIIEERNRFKNAKTAEDYALSGDRSAELETLYEVLESVSSVILAGMATDPNSPVAFGENQFMNTFLEEHFPDAEKYGLIRPDLGFSMLGDLIDMQSEISYLMKITEMNSVNMLGKHERTGKRIVQLYSKILKNKDEYKNLSNLRHNDVGLFDGIESISTPTLDTADPNTLDSIDDSAYAEIAALQDLIYDNFQKMIESENDTKVLQDLFSNIGDYFANLNLQESTPLLETTKKLSDFDAYVKLVTNIALRHKDFDYYLREVLEEEQENKYAPLLAQEWAIELGVALAMNPKLMSQALKNISFKEGELGSELIRLPNTAIINGIGGAGKTAVIVKLINKIVQKMNPNVVIWKSAPTDIQVENLNNSIAEGDQSFTIEELMKAILPSEVYGDLQTDLDKENGFKTFTVKEIEVKEGDRTYTEKVPVINEVEYNQLTKTPDVIYIDEVTYGNTLYMQHLSKFAEENNIAIIGLGDLKQRGYENPKAGVYNIDPSTTLALRSPKIDISMRVTNIQQADNVTSANAILDAVDYNKRTKAELIQNRSSIIKEYKEIVGKLQLKYFKDNTNILNGTTIVDSVQEEEIKRMLDEDTVLGYIYDDENSTMYQLMKRINDGLGEDQKIKFYTMKSVQGSELNHFIIDVDFSGYGDLSSKFSDAHDFMKTFYTMLTRSKKGSYFINRGLSNIISPSNVIRQNTTTNTRDNSALIAKFKESRVNQLNEELGDYTPEVQLKEAPQEAPATPIVTAEGITSDPIVEEMVQDYQPGDTGEIGNIRAYGFYMRSGLRKVGDNYEKVINANGVVDDFNALMSTNSIDQTEFDSIVNAVSSIRSIILYGSEFTENNIKPILDKYPTLPTDLNVWNNGQFRIRVKKDSSAKANKFSIPEQFIDRAIGKKGYDESKVERVAFDIVYRLDDNGKQIEFTLGKLANPTTWKNSFAGKTIPTEVNKALTDYNNWYEARTKEAEKTPEYFDLNKSEIKFLSSTRLVPTYPAGIKDANKNIENRIKYDLKDFRKQFPHTRVSPIYIYTGIKGLVNGVSDKVLGRAVIFVTNSRDIDEDNLMQYYIENKGQNDKVRMIVLNPKGYHVSDFLNFSFKDFGLADSASIKKFVGTLGSNTTAARMYTAFWNYRSSLLKMKEQYDNFAKAYSEDSTLFQNGDVTKAGADKFNSEILYKDSEFRLTPPPENGINSPMGSLTTYNVEGKKKNGVQVNYTQILTGIETIDALFDHIFDKAIKFPDPISKNTFMKLDIVSNALSNYSNGGITLDFNATKTDGTTEVYNMTNDTFVGAGAFKIVSMLSTMYKMLNSKGYRSVNHSALSTTDTFGNPIAIDMLEASAAIKDIADSRLGRTDGGDSKTRSLFNTLVNMVLEGNPDPSNNPTTTGENRRGFAPFKYGIFSQARYASYDSENIADFYQATNTFEQDQYDFNVVPEDPVFEITIPDVKSIQPSKDGPKIDRQAEYNNRISSIVNDVVQKVNINLTTNTLQQFTNDTNFENDLKSAIIEVRNTLNKFLNQGTLTTKNGDRILSLDLTEDGNLNILSTLYTSKALTQAEIMPKTEDGALDISKISSINYEDSINKNFVITLQDGNSIKGTINGTSVEVLPQTTYNLGLLTNKNTIGIVDNSIKYIQELGIETNPLIEFLESVKPFILNDPNGVATPISLEARKQLGSQAEIFLKALNDASLYGTSETVLLAGMLDSEGMINEEFTEIDALTTMLEQLSTLQNIEQDQCKINLF